MSNTEFSTVAVAFDIDRAWSAVLTVGIATIALGAVLLAWPAETLSVVSILLGIQFVMFGVFRLAGAFRSDAVAPALFGVIGALMIASGVIILRNRFETLAVLATLLGLLWIVSGAIDLLDALTDSGGERRLIRMLLGFLSLVSGVVVVAWPTPTLTVIAWIAGLHLVLFGVLLVASAFSIRKLAADGAGA